ncbi:MAG: hypothetical protein SynsKO_28100 [Synoicihabitans sp.]
MTPRFSFITANFVARPLGYHMSEGWAQGDDANHAEFKPLGTFRERFDRMLSEVKELGFQAIDLWAAHLHWHWASLEHIAIAKDLLRQHEIEVRSYAAWVGGDCTDLRGACRLCREFNIPYISGFIAVAEQAENRDEAVAILREFAVGYGIENHPETSIADLAARLGEGAEDVIGIALDTGWAATRGWDALTGLQTLADRIFTVHLKDVKAPPVEPTGFEFIDMGHETCRLGDGVVGIEAIVRWLRETGFRGPMGVEHEPETFDPREECRESLVRVKSWWEDATPEPEHAPLRVAVVGCGNIAGAYGEAMLTRPEIEILGASDLDRARAQEWAEKFGGKAYASLDEVLADPAVEVVVNLTIQHAHVEVVTKALEAGKHVHSEKPLAPTFIEAEQLVAMAAAKNLRLSCAPVTWLGEAQQTTWKMIRDGRIGTPRVVYATVDWARIETWHPNPVPFYAAGPVGDVGVYAISLLTAWFGPVRRVTAGGGILLPDRTTKEGEPFEVKRADYAVAVLEFENGITTRLSANFYVGEPADRRAGLEIHGDEGSIRTEWFAATAPLEIGAFGESYRPVQPLREPAGTGEWYCDWSAGVYELWRALRTDTPHPTSGEQAAHVVEVIESVETALNEGRRIEINSSFAPPPPLEWAR